MKNDGIWFLLTIHGITQAMLWTLATTRCRSVLTQVYFSNHKMEAGQESFKCPSSTVHRSEV